MTYDNNSKCQQDNCQFAGIKNVEKIFIRNVSFNYYFTPKGERKRGNMALVEARVAYINVPLRK